MIVLSVTSSLQTQNQCQKKFCNKLPDEEIPDDKIQNDESLANSEPISRLIATSQWRI